jgi:hypothetical protein
MVSASLPRTREIRDRADSVRRVVRPGAVVLASVCRFGAREEIRPLANRPVPRPEIIPALSFALGPVNGVP